MLHCRGSLLFGLYRDGIFVLNRFRISNPRWKPYTQVWVKCPVPGHVREAFYFQFCISNHLYVSTVVTIQPYKAESHRVSYSIVTLDNTKAIYSYGVIPILLHIYMSTGCNYHFIIITPFSFSFLFASFHLLSNEFFQYATKIEYGDLRFVEESFL